MNGSVNDLVRYRLARAEETLAEARLLAERNHWNAAVNRLYYACFYAVLALFAQRGLTSSKHSGIRSLFNIHFVKTGRLSKEMASTYNDLFERHQEGDYDDYVVFSPGRCSNLDRRSRIVCRGNQGTHRFLMNKGEIGWQRGRRMLVLDKEEIIDNRIDRDVN